MNGWVESSENAYHFLCLKIPHSSRERLFIPRCLVVLFFWKNALFLDIWRFCYQRRHGVSKQRHGIGSPLSVSLCARKGTRQTRSPTGRGKLVFLQVRINIFITLLRLHSLARAKWHYYWMMKEWHCRKRHVPVYPISSCDISRNQVAQRPLFGWPRYCDHACFYSLARAVLASG